jgi:TctA family transporter
VTLSILFWVLMIVWVFFDFWRYYEPGKPYPMRSGAGTLLVFVLLGILGWAVFGAPVHH